MYSSMDIDHPGAIQLDALARDILRTLLIGVRHT